MTGDSVLASDEFQKPPGVRGVLDRELQHDFNYYTGGLPCESGRKAAVIFHTPFVYFSTRAHSRHV